MSKIKSLAGAAIIATVAIGGAVASTGSAMAADAPAKKPAVGPYKCATSVPLASEDLMLGHVGLSCDEAKADDPETNVNFKSRLAGIELPDKKGPALTASVMPKSVKAEEGGPVDTLPLPVPGK